MFEWKASNAVFLDENTGGKGKYFRARILQAGLVKYSFGVCLLEKETIDKFIWDFVGCPVVIDHKDVTSENAKDERVGVISRVWFEQDGWYWVEGIIFDEKAISLVNDGYNVSCQYEISEYANNMNKALHNGNPYDKVILNGKPEHLAIVKNPRYENAMIAVNAMEVAMNQDDDIVDWITVKGNHVPVRKGQSHEEAAKQFIESKKGKEGKSKNNDKKITSDQLYKIRGELISQIATAERVGDKEKLKKLNKEYDGLLKQEQELYKKEQEAKKKEDNGTPYSDMVEKTKKRIEFVESRLKDKNSPEKHEALVGQFEHLKGALKYYQEHADYDKKHEEVLGILDEMWDGAFITKEQWHKLEKTLGVSVSDEEFNDIVEKHPLDDQDFDVMAFDLIQLAKKKAKNSIIQAINEIKETDMFSKLFKKKEKKMDKDELKSLFMECLSELTAKNEADEKKEDDKLADDKVADNEEDDKKEEKKDEEKADNKCKNEVVDKRDIIRQIMAIAGKEEASEDAKEIAKLAEKLAYDKSEADKKADNKCKNEDDKDDDKDDDKKVENEEKEDEKEKASNSLDEIIGKMSAGTFERKSESYLTQKKAVELGDKLF